MKTKILILGAGFAGIYSAVNLGRRFRNNSNVEITLVDGNGFHLFKPMLHEVATGSVNPTHIIQPVRTVVSRCKNVEFVEGVVQRIDFEERKVYQCSDCAHCARIKEGDLKEFDIQRVCVRPLKRKVHEYDYLVIAIGGVPNFYDIPGVKEHALPLYSLDDAVKIREHVAKAFEIADHIEDDATRKRILTFIVAGAGPTGIEVITDLHDWIYGTLVNNYENITADQPRLIILEAGKDILPFSAENIRRDAGKIMDRMKIEIMTGSPVERLEKNRVHIGGDSGREIDTNSLIWAAGIKANELLEQIDLEKDNTGRVVVNDYFEVPSLKNVYAVGDCARFQSADMKSPLPQTGQVAVQGAAGVVDNIIRSIEGRPKKPFVFRNYGSMISLGEMSGAGNFFGFIGLSGFLGWLSWKLVYLKHLLGIHKNIRVVLEWFFDLTYDREASRHKFG